jgi:hypothetical protein
VAVKALATRPLSSSTGRDSRAVDAEWEVTVLQQPGSLAEVTHADGAIVLRVGDHEGPTGDPSPSGDPRSLCCTTVTCLRGGRIVVHAGAAPPALLVGPTRTVLVPSVPDVDASTVVGPGERVFVLSASAFDTLPPSLATVLRELPQHVLGTSPESVLQTVFSEIPVGCGALIAPVDPGAQPLRTEPS